MNSMRLGFRCVVTLISLIEMTVTEQWLLATKSTFTPYVPAHLVSPMIELSPITSLKTGGNEKVLDKVS